MENENTLVGPLWICTAIYMAVVAPPSTVLRKQKRPCASFESGTIGLTIVTPVTAFQYIPMLEISVVPSLNA